MTRAPFEMRAFTDREGRSWEALVEEQPGTDYKGRYFMVLRPTDAPQKEYRLEWVVLVQAYPASVDKEGVREKLPLLRITLLRCDTLKFRTLLFGSSNVIEFKQEIDKAKAEIHFKSVQSSRDRALDTPSVILDDLLSLSRRVLHSCPEGSEDDHLGRVTRND